MAQILGLPKLSPTMEEGVLLRWVKKEGDKVSPGDLVAEVETDKANMDFNIEDEGTLLRLLVKEGQTVKLGAPVAIIGKPGDDIAALLAQAQGQMGAAPATPPPSAAPATAAPPAAKAPPAPTIAPATAAFAVASPRNAGVAAAPAPSPPSGAGLLASPLAKTLAAELGVDLRAVRGSGPGGRIVERDVRAAAGANNAGVVTAPLDANDSAVVTGAIANNFSTPIDVSFSGPVAAPSAQASAAHALATRRTTDEAAAGDYVDVPASNMRKRIAARLTEAKNGAPHFYLMRQFDAAPLLAFRARLNALLAGKAKVSVNDLIIKAVALALRRVPACNAAWIGDGIRYFRRVHIGVAVAIEDGLVTPVVRDTDLKGLGSIASEVVDLAERARTKQLKGHEITGSTFTISNLGMFGIERFTAIINPPEAAILAVGTIVDTPVVQEGAVVPGKRMTLTLSCDHRVIDGALGAELLAALVALLEQPEALAL